MVWYNVTSILIDLEGNKWFGTASGVSMLVDSSTGIKDIEDIAKYSNLAFSIYASGKNLVIQYKHKTHGKVAFYLYDLKGKCIQQILEYRPIGIQSVKLKTADISCGSYLCQIKTADGISVCQKIMILR